MRFRKGLVKHIRQIFRGPYFGPLAVPMFVEDFPRRPMGRLVPIKRDGAWRPPLVLERPPKKRLGGRDIPLARSRKSTAFLLWLGAEQEIDSLSLLVDRTIEVSPAAFDLHVDPMREVDGDRRSLAEWDCNHALWRMAMPNTIRNDIGAIFVSLELSRSKWLITSLSPGGGERMSKHTVPGGDICALLARFSELQRKALARTGTLFPVIVVQEAGLDGFWIHRLLEKEGIEGHVVDAASIAVARRRRRAKTDGIDGETLLRTLLAYKRNEPRVCAMVKAPTIEEEDRRRLCRERKTLMNERVVHVNRIKGLLFSQGVSYVDGPPWQALFLRFERFGRLRSYVRPVDAEHMSAGLDEVRRPGSLSCERALRSWRLAGCSWSSVATVSFITSRCACQTRTCKSPL